MSTMLLLLMMMMMKTMMIQTQRWIYFCIFLFIVNFTFSALNTGNSVFVWSQWREGCVRGAFGGGNGDTCTRTTLTNKQEENTETLEEKKCQNNTAHEPQITSIHQKYLRRLFYVLKFCFYILLVALTTCSHIIFYCELFILFLFWILLFD